MMEYKSAPLSVQHIEDRTVTGLPSVFGNIDDGDDIVHPGAFAKTIQESLKRVRHLWEHDFHAPPTAVITSLEEIKRDALPADIKSMFPAATGGLLVKREYLDTPRGNEILYGIRNGAITEMSFGYDPVKKERETVDGKSVRHLREVKLYETSDVQWGMNPATRASKGAIPFHATPKADKGMPWDGPGQVAAASVDDLKAMCAWVDDQEADVKSGYKLPHHDATGNHAVVWNGVKAAMGALMGAQGGVNIPDGDRRGVYNHLAKHYAEFEEQPPDYKFMEFAFAVKETRELFAADAELKVGRMINADNLDKLKKAIETLQAILDAAEPPKSALTVNAAGLLARLAIAERELQWG